MKTEWFESDSLRNYEVCEFLNRLTDLGVTPDSIKLTRGGHGTRVYFLATREVYVKITLR